VVVASKFLMRPPPPPPPPPPPAPEASVTGMLRYTAGFYRAILEEDSKHFGIPPVTADVLAAPLLRTDEVSSTRTLKPGETLETPHLKLQTQVIKEWAKGGSGQGFRFEHLVLSIVNKSGGPLAYRVETAVDQPEKCRSQGAISHNAIALAAGEKVERTECLYHPGMTLKVNAAETIALPPIGYFYVSRMDPSQIGLEGRTSAGHAPPHSLPVCKFVPWRDIELGGASWADVIDFYARHNCDEYTFYRQYRFRTAVGPLPAHEEKGAGGGAAGAAAAAATP
jgi:hypothetical protein